ncbi:S1-like domain-containing RNA-binding protein [Halobacillus litoralis]|uniref:CvfB family protein n=1 Tax=Halobacillus litoralis TaxID=45668 RepID=UPI001CFEAFC8|nr:S1-like domain-containing RNA-binding protein [Halobacillus litoralis]WLR46833.1 S1-like domain-containing RNA-binding protein [Halobacillus litoralis]
MKDVNILGTIQQGKIKKKITEGFIVHIQNEEVVLPDENVTEEIELDESRDMFIYENKKGQASATMEIPEVTKDTYGWSEVVEVVPNMGVFVDIGLTNKDILVSSDHLPLLKSVWPTEGDHLFVSLELDKKGRLLAEPISEQEVMDDLEPAPKELLGQEVTARVYRATKAGSTVLTGEGYRGFIHPSERKEEPRLGETITARIIDVKDDGTINLSLRPLKQEGMKEDAEIIYEYLQENDGVMFLHDKSDPEDIRKTFKISKSAFKRALGQLMKERKIIQENGKTVINHNRT